MEHRRAGRGISRKVAANTMLLVRREGKGTEVAGMAGVGKEREGKG